MTVLFLWVLSFSNGHIFCSYWIMFTSKIFIFIFPFLMAKTNSCGVQIWVYGNSFESFLVGVVVPDQKALEDWARNHNVIGDFKSLCENLEARKYILDELNSNGQKHHVSTFKMFNFSQDIIVYLQILLYLIWKLFWQLRGFELLKAIHLEPYPFDMERDLITPTFKLKRPQLLKYYKVRLIPLKSFRISAVIFYSELLCISTESPIRACFEC